MKQRKKRKKDQKYKYNNKKSFLIFVMLICIIIAMITYWIYAYNYKYGNLYFVDDKIISYNINDYVDISGDTLYLKNINDDISNNFVKEQEDIINNNNVVSIDITKGLYDNILSVMINYTLYDGTTNYEKILTLNIDLYEDRLLSSDDMLNIVGISYKDIATSIFDEYIKLPDDRSAYVIDSITDSEMSSSEFNDNSYKYITRIREELPEIINIYIEDNKVYYIVSLIDIEKVCYYTDNNRLVNIKKEIGEI